MTVVYVDTSREFGIGIAVFQQPKDIEKPQFDRPIMFLSRALKPAEQHYWPTELEACGLVWAITKLRHIVQVAPMIVYTDHQACEPINKMKSLETTSPGKKNLRLANWAIFLSQFWHHLEIRYYKGIENVLADALS